MRSLALVVLLLTACTSGQTFIDGIPIGEPTDGDVRYDNFAKATIDAEIPGHAPIAAIEYYTTNWRTTEGDQILFARSGGGNLIAVLRLTDGTVRSYHLGCGVGLATEMCFVGDRDPLGTQ